VPVIVVVTVAAFVSPVTPGANVATPIIVAAKEDDIRGRRPNHCHAAAIVVHVTHTSGKYDQKRSEK